MPLEIKAVKDIHNMTAFVRILRSISSYSGMKARPQPDSISNYDPVANPVHRHLKTAYFMAVRDKIPVGRIAAIKDFLNPDKETGFFGCFECEDDTGAASALIETARQWLSNNGCHKMIGPATFNTNQQVGTLIEGYESGPQILLPYNPPCYRELMEKSGLIKHTDLVTYSWYREMGIPGKIARVAERARRTSGMYIQRLNLINLWSEARLVADMFNRSMFANWGYIPMTLEESWAMLSFCRMYADRDLMVTVWADGHPAGILLYLPASLSSCGPFRKVRGAILGVVPQYRHRGLDSYLMEHTMETMLRKGYEQADISMIHEENKVMLKTVTQVIGATQTRRYRVYASG